MNDNNNFSLAELERRLANMIRVGTVVSVDAEAARCRVKIDDLVTAPLRWTASRIAGTRTWWAPEAGEQVMVHSPFGDFAQGVVTDSLYQDNHPAPSADPNKRVTDYGDGTVITYDKTAHKLTINCAGDVAVIASSNVDVSASGNVNVSAADQVNVTAQNDITLASVNGQLNIGGPGGKRVARLGDRVQVTFGSSAGLHPIVEASDTVKAT